MASLSVLPPKLYLRPDRGDLIDAPRGARRCKGTLRPCAVVANRARHRAENFIATRATVKTVEAKREKGERWDTSVPCCHHRYLCLAVKDMITEYRVLPL